MQKRYRLTNNASFNYINSKGKRGFGKHIVLSFVPASSLKIGVVVTKKVGKSVVRSKVKRRIKESFRSLIPRLCGKHNYVVVAKEDASSATYSEILAEIRGILTKNGHLA